MKRFLFFVVFATIGAFAVQVNDLAPDFDNTISDDGFWDTTGHQDVVVAEAASDTSIYAAIDSVTCGMGSGAMVAAFDSRETTQDEATTSFQFSSKPRGIVIDFH